MALFDTFTKPQTRQLPLALVERINQDYRYRDVIPSRNGKHYQLHEITVELMERYFQVKPQVRKPNVSIPGGAIAVLCISALLVLIGLVAFRTFFFFLIIGVGGIAGGLYWIYKVYEPVRTYLFELEDYLLRDTLSYEAYKYWMDARVYEVIKTTSERLHISLENIVNTGRGERVISDPRLIMGYHTCQNIQSQSSIKFYFIQNARLFFSVTRSLFNVADHVEYINGENQVTDSHWRIISYLFVLPQDNALAVYETTIDAANLRSTNDVTSEYFYQSVLGLRTRVNEAANRASPRQTEFTLLIGHGFSPSITTTSDLGITIKVLREAISEKKALALRKEMAGGGSSTDIPWEGTYPGSGPTQAGASARTTPGSGGLSGELAS